MSNADSTTDHQSDPAPPSDKGRGCARGDSAGLDPENDDLPFDNEELCELWQGFRPPQRLFVIKRLDKPTDKAAAEELGWSKHTPWSWDNKRDVNRAVELMIDEMAQAKSQGLHEGFHIVMDRLKQIAAEGDDMAAVKAGKILVEQVLGKPTQKSEVDMKADVDVDANDLDSALDAVSTAASQLSSSDEEE